MGDQPQVPSGGQNLSNLYPTPSSADFTSHYPPSQHPQQPQQGQYNPPAPSGPIGGIPDAARGAMWQQFEQSVRSGTAMTPQQVAAQLSAGAQGRPSVSLFMYITLDDTQSAGAQGPCDRPAIVSLTAP